MVSTATPVTLAAILSEKGYDLSGATDKVSLIEWLRDNRPDAYEVALEHTWKRWQAIPYALRTERCVSGAVTMYCEYLAHNKVPRRSVTEVALPIPIFTLGYRVAVGHHDPDAFNEIPFLPEDLTLRLLLSKKDYEAARTDFLEQLSFLFTGEIKGNGFQDHEPFVAPVSRSRNDQVREALLWMMRLPLISQNNSSTLQAALSAGGEIDMTRIPMEYTLSIDHLLNATPVISADMLLPDRSLAEKLGADLLASVAAYPLLQSREFIWVLTPDPTNYKIKDTFASKVRQTPILVRCAADELHRIAQGERQSKTVGTPANRGAFIGAAADKKSKFSIEPREYERASQNLFDNIEYYLKWILCEAMRRGASDIHIDQFGEECRFRCEVDGGCSAMISQPESRKGQIKSKLQQWADIRLDGREPAEGHFTFTFAGRDVDVRVALAYSHGADPKFTLRLLDKTLSLRSLNELGLAAAEIKLLREHVTKKQGIILTSGPTGAGKSTTMAALLLEVNSPDKAIYTLEDPIEYVLPGVTQIQVSSDPTKVNAVRPSFADAAKLLLRHAPKIIMIGEIRDNATAQAAAELSMTGHLVVSTVHANDVFTVVNRLRGKNVDARDLADGFRLITSQRLIRRLCKCHRVREADQQTVDFFGSKGVQFSDGRRLIGHPEGCPDCNYSGYKGRICVLESLVVDHEIRDLIADSEKTSAIRTVALQRGYIPLFAQGLHKVIAGHTSLAEVRHHIEE